MENTILNAITLLERIPAVEDIHVFETTYLQSDPETTVELPITLWFDDFQYGVEDDGDDSPATETDKIHQLESILTAYLDGSTVEVREAHDGSGSHIVVLQPIQTWNPIPRLKHHWNALRWRWHVWNTNTHIDVTPLPLGDVADAQV